MHYGGEGNTTSIAVNPPPPLGPDPEVPGLEHEGGGKGNSMQLRYGVLFCMFGGRAPSGVMFGGAAVVGESGGRGILC